jgi:ABC-type antimicrobial peptide transport system permease subunit
LSQQAATPLSGASAGYDEVVELERGIWRRMGGSLLRDKMALVGAFIVLAFVLVAIFAPLLAPHDPTLQFTDGLSPQGAPLPPGGQVPLRDGRSRA